MEGDTTLNTTRETTICSLTECTEDCDENILTCVSCKRFVHFKCTNLPLYQLQLILNTKSKRYTCQNCVEISKDLFEKVPRQSKKEKSKKENEWLRREIKGCENVIRAQKTTIESQKEELEFLKEEFKKSNGNKTDINGRLKESLDQWKQEFDKQMNVLNESITTKITEFTKMEKSFAEAVKITTDKTPTSLRTIIQEARNEEAKENRDKKSRRNNVIIHGIKEIPGSKEALNKWDDTFVRQLLKDVKVEASTQIERIGTPSAISKRPLKIVFQTHAKKESLMSNLKLLKNVEQYRGISVTEDFTKAERNLIKVWTEKAKEKNSLEPYESNVIWRVRGSPRSTLFLKKFESREQWHSQ